MEDEALILMNLEEVFSGCRARSHRGKYGWQCKPIAKQYPGQFVTLVTDFNMPGRLHGGHLIKLTCELYPTISSVLATAVGRSVTSKWGARYGVTLIEKPYLPKSVVNKVSSMLLAA